MICWFKVEGVGAVGAKLYPDKSIQHAGITLGLNDFANLEKNSQKGSVNFNLKFHFLDHLVP